MMNISFMGFGNSTKRQDTFEDCLSHFDLDGVARKKC